MGLSMKIRLVLAAALLLSTAPAHAQIPLLQLSREGVSGKPIYLSNFTAIDPDCSHVGYVDVRVRQQPRNGRIQISRANVFPVYPPTNPRQACASRRVPGIEIHYISGKGFVGTDSATVEAISPRGNTATLQITITVK